jgi:NTE family protein
MSRALVLGGGGPLGVGWEAGLLAGLADAGVVLRQADAVVGTSAGSVVGAQLTSDRMLADVVPPISEAPPWALSESAAGPPDLAEMLARGGGDAVPEDEFVARFAFLRAPWPETFRCTSFGLDTGQFVVWDQASGVELHRAVAASCSVPGISPAITIAGTRYMDGGARDMLNADLAVGHDIVVTVSCMALDPPEGLVPDLIAGLLPAVRERIEDLRSSGSAVEVVEPSDEVRELSGWGRYLMDFARTAAAYDAGVRQSKTEAARLERFWSS